MKVHRDIQMIVKILSHSWKVCQQWNLEEIEYIRLHQLRWFDLASREKQT